MSGAAAGRAGAAVSLVRWKFNRMLAVATVVMAVNYLVMLSGSVIVGNLVGADGLAGVNACTPAFGAASFLASLLSIGSGLVFARALGAFDLRRAAGVYSQSMMLAVGLGVVIYAAMRLGETAYLDLTGVEGAVRFEAVRFWRWQAVAMALLPSVLTLETLVYADGDCAVALLAGALHVTGAVGLAAFCTWRDGHAGGASFGTAVTMAVVLLACSLHFLRAGSHLKFRVYFSLGDLRETLKASLADSTIYLCWGALVFVVNKFAVERYGQGELPLVALAASVVEFSIVFDGVGEVLIPLGGTYAGEGNRSALRELANWSALVAVAEGVVCGAAFFWLAPWIARWYGDFGPSAEQYANAVGVIRVLAFAMPFMGLMMMMNTHYLVVRHLRLAVSVTVMKDFVCPCVGVLALGSVGEAGVWFGFTAGYVLAAAYPFAFVWMRHGRGEFPWLIGDCGRSVDFSVRLTEGSLAAVGGRVAECLGGFGVAGEVVARVRSVVERTGAATIARNASGVIAEYFATVGEDGAVRLVIRDNGRIEDEAESPPVGDGVSCRRLNALCCNRSEWRFWYNTRGGGTESGEGLRDQKKRG